MSQLNLSLRGPSYPLELLADAERLAVEAAGHPLTDGRNLTSPRERTFARSAIFTAFNFLESLFIELTQEALRASSVPPAVKAEIEQRLRRGRASISRTIKEWPAKLQMPPVHGRSEFKSFRKLRRLRNNLVHPKLEPLQPSELTQDELLQAASARNAAWAVSEVKKMGRVLYGAFGAAVPPEVA